MSDYSLIPGLAKQTEQPTQHNDTAERPHGR